MGPIPSVTLSRRAKIALAVAVILVVLIVLVVRFAGIYINYLWFGEVGHRNVYSTVIWTKVVLFFVFGILMAAIICGNLIAAYLTRPPFRPMSPEQQNLQHYVTMVEPRRRLLIGVVGLISLLAAGASAQGKWSQWQLYLHGVSWGIKDPIFGKDISFYTWDYPVYRILLGFAFSAVIFSLILTVALHYVTGAIRLQTPGPKITMAARRQITILIFFFIAFKAIAYWLDRYGLLFSHRSKFTGASYTDVHSALPARTILFWIAVVLAVGVLASLWLKSSVLPGIGFIVLIVFSILIGGIYPAIVQSVSVSPNASTKEQPYIRHNIAATRYAYGIQTATKKDPAGAVTYKNYKATSDPLTSAVTNANATVDNIRILDPNVISPTVTNAQKIALPYGFASKLNVDRYTVKGQVHDYIVGVRQLKPSNLSGNLNNWINQYTVYTHGYGFVAARASDDVTNGRASDYTEGDIPPKGPLGLTVPQVYYGQGMNSYSVVGAKGAQPEYDGSGKETTRYDGSGGVPLSSLFTRLAFALKFKETNFLLNSTVSDPGARAIINRDPSQLVKKIAPFLTIDGAPYPFVDKATGHIMWMVDGYTTTANYPYSERQSLSSLTGTSIRRDQPDTQINYIRNSVKATVDAYTGQVKLYAWDKSDPVLRSYESIFPHLVLPRSDMPKDVLAHVRYPQDLFNVQRGLLAQYHITNPIDSYNGRGKWAVPNDPFGAGSQPSYYVLADSPDNPDSTGTKPEFQLTTPMVVPGSSTQNLASYISVDSDPGPDYGKLTVLQVPTNAAVQGPGQVANVFKTKAQISKDIQQLGTGQSVVVHGNLLTLPVGNSFLYVEPLYVRSTGGGTSFPTLQRVLVTYGDNIGYAADLQEALADITLGRTAGSSLTIGQTTPTVGGSGTGAGTGTATPTSTPTSSSTSTPPVSSTLPTTLPGVIAAIGTAKDQLAAAKNLAQVSAAYARLERLEKQLAAVQAKSAPPSATPTNTP